jgi:hypothetical protein
MASAWTAPQLVDALPDDIPPRWLLRDRDNIDDDQAKVLDEPPAERLLDADLTLIADARGTGAAVAV